MCVCVCVCEVWLFGCVCAYLMLIKLKIVMHHLLIPTSYALMHNKYNIKAPILIVLYLFFGRTSTKQTIMTQTYDHGTVRNKYWRAHIATNEEADEQIEAASATEKGELLAKLSNNSRPFNYIGDINPSNPLPWPETEKDWWSLHETLVENVKKSDESLPKQFDITNSRLPQLIFYGDSITEGWGGTSFGNIPGKHRMWKPNEYIDIQNVFDVNFGSNSVWGKRALKQPLILGISGSRTYDFIWRIENGEFPSSTLLDVNDNDENGDEEQDEKEEESKEKVEEEEASEDTFDLGKLERIYIVLMGTNNLGGGMLPTPTIEGMDAVGRSILQLHKKKFPGVPSAMLFSELLPRKDNFRAEKMCPPRCANITTLEPYKSFMPAIDKVNKELPRIVNGWRDDFVNSRIVLLSGNTDETIVGTDDKRAVDEFSEEEQEESTNNNYTKTIHCGREMFNIDDMDEYDTYMPDRLHPNSKGYELWSHCLKKGLEVIMDHQVRLEEEEGDKAQHE